MFDHLLLVSNKTQASGIRKTSLLNLKGEIVLVYARSHKNIFSLWIAIKECLNIKLRYEYS
jgi:hypothetical protein